MTQSQTELLHALIRINTRKLETVTEKLKQVDKTPHLVYRDNYWLFRTVGEAKKEQAQWSYNINRVNQSLKK